MFWMNPPSKSHVHLDMSFLEGPPHNNSLNLLMEPVVLFCLCNPCVLYFCSIKDESSLSFSITGAIFLLSFLANQPPSKNCTHAYLSPYPFMRGEHNSTSYDSAVSKYLCPQPTSERVLSFWRIPRSKLLRAIKKQFKTCNFNFFDLLD